MLRRLAAPLIRKRFALWVLGQALPEASALRPNLRAALLGVVMAALCGVMIALVLALLLLALHQYLVAEGLRASVSLMMVGGIGLLIAGMAYVFARHSLDTASQMTEKFQLFPDGKGETVGRLFNTLMNGFLEGLTDKSLPAAHLKREKEEDSREGNTAEFSYGERRKSNGHARHPNH